METFLLDVASLTIRWLHIITGIAWVGASFYFIWLDNNLESPPEEKQAKGIKGDLWSFHGGGIYEVSKYQSAPKIMPKNLHWFYWEAYSTWLTGMALLFVVYYLQATSYLVPVNGLVTSPTMAIVASLLYLGFGLLIYELIIKLGLASRAYVFIAAITLLLTLFSWLSMQLFSPRAAYLHVGMLIGTIMVSNVFIGIIPPQRKFIKAIEQGTEPDTQALLGAKLRSTHNNYFTLPVLFCMISNHYPFLYGHRYNWLILLAIIAITMFARQFFILKHRGIIKPSILIICALLFISLMALLAWDKYHQEQQASSAQISNMEAMAIVNTHCSVCHSNTPTFTGFSAPPLGVVLNTLDDLHIHADKAQTLVMNNYMPLGNLTKMTDEERVLLSAWLREI